MSKDDHDSNGAIRRRDVLHYGGSFATAAAFSARTAGLTSVAVLATSEAAHAQDVALSVPPVSYQLGVPTAASAKRMLDELAYQRAVQVYLHGLPAVGMQQYRNANAGAMDGGSDDHKVGYLGDLMKSNILHVTGNPDSMYIDYFFDTKAGPIVLEVPSTLPGFLDDMWEMPVIDVIPSVSPSGKYVIAPPGWTGEAPKDFVVARPKTYVSWLLLRGNVEQKSGQPDTTTAVREMKEKMRVYPLAELGKESSRKLAFYNMSDKKIDRIPPEGLEYFKRLAEVVGSEPKDQQDPYVMGLLKSIGIEPGKPFAPDARMLKILEAAAKTGQAMAQSISFHGNEAERWHWPDRNYAEAFMGGSPSFIADGHFNHDARTYFFYLACGTSKLMASTTPGQGQAYPWAAKDAKGNIFDGGKTYRMHLPPNVPAKLYWSVTLYDTVTRSQIENGGPFAKISTFTNPKLNADGSYDLYFGPKAPEGKEGNWAKTVPNRGWFFLFRLYGPGTEYFDRTWKPDDLVEVS
jgi:hypothetical protein